MSATRRGFLGWLAGALSVAPAIVQAEARAPRPSWKRVTYARHAIEEFRDKNVLLRVEDYAGVPQVSFRNIPIKVVDSLL